uniref:Tc1-like transposase DDE domain-containing protein n=1 Tax=Phytophthora ramorum TaxID=164328 RepID=H3H641_PHYRM
MPKDKKHRLAARTRVLEAYKDGRGWHGATGIQKRGGAREACTKCTAEMEEALAGYLEENGQYTLPQMVEMLHFDYGVRGSTSLVRVEQETYNNAQNLEKRRVFGEALLKYEKEGAFIVYYDETNYNLYCKRTQGRTPIGLRAVVKLPPSKGANLQLQCAVSAEIGLVHYATQRDSIKMEINAVFMDAVYDAVKDNEVFRANFVGKGIVIVLDNSPAHSQTEGLVQSRADLKLLWLGPFSLM